MDASAIKAITDLSAPNISNHYNYAYTDKRLSVVEEPKVVRIEFSTIKGLVDTLVVEHEKFLAPLIVSVKDFNTINVLGAINPNDRKRENPYIAVADSQRIVLNEFTSHERMMIQLKAMFIETDELLDLVRLLGTMVEENAITHIDDGFTQSVVVKNGVVLKENKVVNPRVKLKPYRTFADVEQPESEFIVRLKDGGQVALFEADGGAWKIEARKIIADRLREDLADLLSVGSIIVTE